MAENGISISEIKNILEAKGIRPSFQRISILKYIMEKMDHPSVEEIYGALVNQIPTLSKTTVYNTLNYLIEKGIITALTIDDKEGKYDYIEVPHAHFLCIKCGKIYDIELDSEIYGLKSSEGHEINDVQINFKGICKNCK